MAAYAPISLSVPQYVDSNGDPYSGAVLKAYASGTSSNISMATDSGGGTTFTSVALNSNGYPEHSGTIVIPHVNVNYKLSLYPTQAAADANSGAIWTIDSLTPVAISRDFSVDDAVSSGITNVVTVTHTTTGTPVAGIGTGLGFVTETAAGNNETGMVLASEITDVTSTSEDFDFVVKLMAGGDTAAEKFRVTSAGVMTVATISPTNALALNKGGTGSTTASGARTNLELETISQSEAEAGIGTTTRAWNAVRVAQAIAALGGVSRGFIDGLILSNDTDTDHDTNISAGLARDSTNTVTMVLASEITKQIDATFATGDDAGGLASGATLGNTTWYHYFLVSISGTIDVIIDTSVICANGVANNGVTAFRRIGSRLTNGSANLISQQQRGNIFTWDVPVRDVSTNNPGTSAVTATLSTPLGVVTRLNGTFYMDNDGSTVQPYALVTALAQADTTPSSTVYTVKTAPDATSYTDVNISNASVSPFTNTSSQIRYRLSASSTAVIVQIMTNGWEDFRGQE